VQAGVRVVRKVDEVRISGATGVHAASVNGVYHPVSGEACGGRPVYKKEDGDSWIEYRAESHKWQVKAGASRGGDTSWMSSAGVETQAGAVEEVTGGWVVSNDDASGFSLQEAVSVEAEACYQANRQKEEAASKKRQTTQYNIDGDFNALADPQHQFWNTFSLLPPQRQICICMLQGIHRRILLGDHGLPFFSRSPPFARF